MELDGLGLWWDLLSDGGLQIREVGTLPPTLLMAEQKPEYSTLKDAFCARYRSKPARFVTDVFWKCLPAHAVIPAVFVGGPVNSRFDHDTEAIASLADATCLEDLNEGLDELVSMQRMDHSRLRQWFGIRVSSTRLRNLLLPLLDQVRRPVEPVLPESNPEVGVARSAALVPSLRGSEMSTVGMRQVMRIHAAVTVGVPLERVLEEESLPAAHLEAFLSEFSQLRPESAWLLSYIRDREELAQLRAEFKRQDRQEAR